MPLPRRVALLVAPLVAALSGFGLACSSPHIVDCGMDGRFTRVDNIPWCVYDADDDDNRDCPSDLPVVHELRFGYGCAEERVTPLPPTLCEAVGACGDAG